MDVYVDSCFFNCDYNLYSPLFITSRNFLPCHDLQAKANDGEGPNILRRAQGGSSGHAESLAATLAEHQQHLASFQVCQNIFATRFYHG